MVHDVHTIEESRAWYNNMPGKRVSAALILRDGDRVLMVKDGYKPFWSFPSGVIDPSEAPFATALRETLEETGIEVSPELAEFFSVAYVPEHDGFLDKLHFFFLTDAITRDAQLIPEDGIESHEWVTIDRIGELAAGRPEYLRLQEMLQAGTTEYYFEATYNNKEV